MEQKLQQPPQEVLRDKGITAVGCIVDTDAFVRAEAFYDLIEEFSLRPNAVKIIGYKRDFDTASPYAIQMFGDKDLGKKGQIENGYVMEFLSREYDMLINYYTDDNLMMKLLSVKTPARLRVGFGSVDAKINDLILNTPLDDFKTFKTELKKYLTVFQEI
ncbi:hypothetical protein [Allomuricauda sp. d1]|uniref:DUF6913 domain-containing protein n=1 Tax=Allomuricauda sp. d1 TaxID=3136725 RepID=UPI0031D9D04B